jgi:hypothetical protein
MRCQNSRDQIKDTLLFMFGGKKAVYKLEDRETCGIKEGFRLLSKLHTLVSPLYIHVSSG